MTDAPEQAELRRKFEAAHREHLENLEKLRATFAELEKCNHPELAWAREELRRVETVHEVLNNAIQTGGHIDPDELQELRGARRRSVESVGAALESRRYARYA